MPYLLIWKKNYSLILVYIYWNHNVKDIFCKKNICVWNKALWLIFSQLPKSFRTTDSRHEAFNLNECLNISHTVLLFSVIIRCCSNTISTTDVDVGQQKRTPHCALTSPRALVVKEDPIDRKHVVGLSEVHHNPVGVQLSGTLEAKRQEWHKKTRNKKTETY